jgi:hypothetical protein
MSLTTAFLRASAAAGGAGALAAAPGWALAMQAALQADIQVLGGRVGELVTSVARLQNRNVHAPADVLAPIPGALAPFAMPAAAQPVVHFPANLADFGALTAAQVRKVLARHVRQPQPGARPPPPLPCRSALRCSCTTDLVRFRCLLS